MAHSVSILDGEVNRNWHLVDSRGEKHLLTLFHDCVTGARAAMLDYVEVPGSAGTTNLFNLVAGKVDIPFTLKDTPDDSGRLSILRRGLTGFSYECELNGRLVLDTTSVVQNTEYEYEAMLPATVDTGNRVNGVTWYEVHTMRKSDGKGTLVHRRFREFVALHNQVESLMKGHHLRSSLPRFPGKKSKLWTNHGDLSFVEDRRIALEQYMKVLLQLPHVSTLDSTRAFLGMVGNLREFSVPWNGKDLGATLKRASEVAGGNLGNGGAAAGDVGAPPVITAVLGGGRSPTGVCPGDRLFKVNGESTEHMSLEAAWSSVKRASRPVMLHFLGPILRMDSTLAPLPNAFLRRRALDNQTGQYFPPDKGGAPPPPAPPGGMDLSGPGGGVAGGGAGAGSSGAGADGQRGLRGMTQGLWPAWGRDQGKAGNVPGAGPTAASPAEAGRARPGGRGVGPFGNGAGAPSGGLKTTSSLFGDGEGHVGRGGGASADALRSSSGVAGGSARQALPARPLGSNGPGGVGPRGRDGWMPVMSTVPGTSVSSAPAATPWGGAPTRLEGAGGTPSSRYTPVGQGDRPAEQQRAAGRIASAGYSADSAASGAIVWPPEQPGVASAKPPGVGAKPSGVGLRPSGMGGTGTEPWRGGSSSSSERGAVGRGGGERGTVAPGRVSAGAEEGRRPSVFASTPIGFGGAAARTGASPGYSYGDTVAAGTSEDEGEEENPFA